MLETEIHHKKGLELLESFMAVSRKPSPGPGHTAHHIVPGKGKTTDANLARVRMHMFGIRINDPDNGVWLPRDNSYTPMWSMPKSKGHLSYHTEGYETWVRKKLDTKSGEVFIRIELNLIGKMLQTNKLPPEARKK